MLKYFLLLCLITLSTLSISRAQNIGSNDYKLTGDLATDSKIVFDSYENIQPVFVLEDLPNKKSPVLAGVMSAIVPGSGEFFVGEYIKAAIFVAVEAALVTTAVIYDNKGDDQTIEFQNFADEKWSVVKYAEYLNSQGADIYINEDKSLPPWERVNWAELNAAETGSHHLPQYGKQQYYELIGKYKQYIPGWPGGNDIVNPPQIMLDYSHMRGEANDTYNVASKAVIGIYINHILSVIDAVWSATSYNNNLAVKIRVENLQLADRIEYVPTLNIKYNF